MLNFSFIGYGRSYEKNVKKIITNRVIIINVKFVLILRLEDENILGIIKKIENGFKTPPVK